MVWWIGINPGAASDELPNPDSSRSSQRVMSIFQPAATSSIFSDISAGDTLFGKLFRLRQTQGEHQSHQLSSTMRPKDVRQRVLGNRDALMRS
jgi:hypothetical protein